MYYILHYIVLVLCTYFPSGRVGIAQLLQLASLPVLNWNASIWLTMPSRVPVGHPTPLRLPIEYPGQLLTSSSAVLLLVGESSGRGMASSMQPITESVARTHSEMVIWTMTLLGLWYLSVLVDCCTLQASNCYEVCHSLRPFYAFLGLLNETTWAYE